MAAGDLKESAYLAALIDRAIETASRTADSMMNRRFWPEIDTRHFDWPNAQTAPAWRLWLDDNELISATAVTAGGITLDPTTYQLEPNPSGPPFTRLELRLDSSATFGGGSTTQRAIGITGLYGYRDDTMSAGVSAGALSASTTTVVTTDPVAIGVGSLVSVGTERMIVTGKTWRTMSQTLQAPVDAQMRTVTITVSTGSAFVTGERILLDSERMQVIDIAGNALTVRRAVDGSVLATHTGSTVYALRTLTVTRGAVGSTAATHADQDPVLVWLPPSGIRTLAIAEALNVRQGDTSGWTGSSGSGETARTLDARALSALRKASIETYGRRARHRAV